MLQQYHAMHSHGIQQLAAIRKLLLKFIIKSARINKHQVELKRKNIHGQYAKYLDQLQVDKERSNQWSTVAVIQEQAISTKYIKKHAFNVESAMSKKKASTTLYQVVMVFPLGRYYTTSSSNRLHLQQESRKHSSLL